MLGILQQRSFGIASMSSEATPETLTEYDLPSWLKLTGALRTETTWPSVAAYLLLSKSSTATACVCEASSLIIISERRAAASFERLSSALTTATKRTPARSTPFHSPDVTRQAINASRPVVVNSPLKWHAPAKTLAVRAST